MEAFERDGPGSAGQADGVADGGDGADGSMVPVVARYEQHLGLVTDVDRERDGHVREDDDVFQRNEQQLPHWRFLISSRYKKDSVGGRVAAG